MSKVQDILDQIYDAVSSAYDDPEDVKCLVSNETSMIVEIKGTQFLIQER